MRNPVTLLACLAMILCSELSGATPKGRLNVSLSWGYRAPKHVPFYVKLLANDIAVMQNGRIVESGPAGEIFDNPQNDYTRQLFRAAFLEN